MRNDYESINYFENATVHAGILQNELLTLIAKVSTAPTYVLHMLLNRTRVEDLTEEPSEAMLIEDFFKFIFRELADRDKREQQYQDAMVKAIMQKENQ